MTTKIYDNKKTANAASNPTTVQQKIDAGQAPQFAENGLFHSPIPEQNISYKVAPNERAIINAGAYIVLGTDRPDSTASGYGSKGSNRANSIDMVVGRMSNARGGKGPPGQEEGTAQVDNSPGADAARILISQLTDVDKNFGLSAGNTGPSKARASIAIKADTVRVIGREGVNIVTGEMKDVEGYSISGETNSMGGRIIKRAPQINLIAGNHTGTYITFGGIYHPLETIKNLQPAVRGQLARDAFLEYAEVTEDLISIMTLSALNNLLHNMLIAFLFPFPVWPAAFGNVSWYATMMSNWTLQSLYQARVTLNFANFNYCNPGGYKYICSRNVHLT
jgi:hypothetical protein